jgi:hypothetical protein
MATYNITAFSLYFLFPVISRLFLVLLVAGPGVLGLVEDRPECALWAKLENKTVPLQNQGHANCTTNNDCTGFNCVGMYQVIVKLFYLLQPNSQKLVQKIFPP